MGNAIHKILPCSTVASEINRQLSLIGCPQYLRAVERDNSRRQLLTGGWTLFSVGVSGRQDDRKAGVG